MKTMAKRFEFHKEQQIDGWTLIEKLGHGGNGVVWKCKNEGNQIAAIKILMPPIREPYFQRFKDEIKEQELLSKDINVMPVLEKSIPEALPSSEYPEYPIYYVMPIGVSLDKHLKGLSLDQRISIIPELLSIFVDLHKMKVAHRDIKVKNFIKLDDRYVLADFGLVFYKGKPRITGPKEKVGARSSMAPEMERPGVTNADFIKADVYSMTMVIWMILTGNYYDSFKGQYAKESDYSLSHYSELKDAPNINWTQLETLLKKGTNPDPKLRPTAKKLCEGYLAWLEKINYEPSWRRRNRRR
jgi:serine/threonine-protein kinase